MTTQHKHACPTCGQSVNPRQISLFEGMVVALWKVFKWCEERNRNEFQKKEIQHLLQQNSISGNFAYWRWWGGGLVYSPNGKAGYYGLNMDRCKQFFTGQLAIPTIVYKDPLKPKDQQLSMPVEEYKKIGEIPKLTQFLDENHEYIARYLPPQGNLFKYNGNNS